jgi:hypothetical protein
MPSDTEPDHIERCIRCDDELNTSVRSEGEFTVCLWTNQETEAYPIHKSCYEEVRDRDLTR